MSPSSPELHSPRRTSCWCGGALDPFDREYSICRDCYTFVYSHIVDLSQVRDDSNDFYGRSYWEKYFPPAHLMPRALLQERTLYWLSTLLPYLPLPPSAVVEVGSSYGAFTYLLDRLGYRATGVELSPSMVEQSTAQFGIPVRQGPVSQAGLVAPLSCIFSFDCLEHVPNPVAELQLYHHLLAPDGLLVVQTPNANLASPKWCSIQFRPQEHLFLFTPDAISQLLHRSGFAHIQFLPSLYWHDMFLIASPHLIQADADRIARILTHHPLVAAMLDMYRRLMNLEPYDCELDQLVSKFYELHQFTANRYKTNNQP